MSLVTVVGLLEGACWFILMQNSVLCIFVIVRMGDYIAICSKTLNMFCELMCNACTQTLTNSGRVCTQTIYPKHV